MLVYIQSYVLGFPHQKRLHKWVTHSTMVDHHFENIRRHSSPRFPMTFVRDES